MKSNSRTYCTMLKELLLREATSKDTDFILGINNSVYARKYFPREKDITKKQHLVFLKNSRKRGDLYFIIQFKGRPIGTVSIYNINSVHKRAEWGRFLLNENVKGVGPIIERKILDIAFKELKLHKLYCQVIDDNSRVVDLHKLFGFKIEGVLREHLFINGKFHDYIFMGKISNDKK